MSAAHMDAALTRLLAHKRCASTRIELQIGQFKRYGTADTSRYTTSLDDATLLALFDELYRSDDVLACTQKQRRVVLIDARDKNNTYTLMDSGGSVLVDVYREAPCIIRASRMYALRMVMIDTLRASTTYTSLVPNEHERIEIQESRSLRFVYAPQWRLEFRVTRRYPVPSHSYAYAPKYELSVVYCGGGGAQTRVHALTRLVAAIEAVMGATAESIARWQSRRYEAALW